MDKLKIFFENAKSITLGFFGRMKSPWGKTTTVGIVVFLMILFWFFSSEAKAQTFAEVSIYAVGVGGERYESETIIITEEFGRKYQAGLLLQLRLDCVDKNECKRGESTNANQAFFIQRISYYGDFSIGIGASYWKNQSPAWNSHTPFLLTMGYRMSDSLSLGYKHFSTGGSSSSNGGLDMLTVRWSF